MYAWIVRKGVSFRFCHQALPNHLLPFVRRELPACESHEERVHSGEDVFYTENA